MDRILIHACPERMWYVKEFLLPSLDAQGLHADVWNDSEGKGNLFSTMESFRECGKNDGATWHLQDDVIICADFAERIQQNTEGVVCGFASQNFGPYMHYHGLVPAIFMWYSFQCIRIPNELANEFTDWFYDDAMHRTKYSPQVVDGKHDDWFWREFMNERHKDMMVTNLAPNLVDHIDYLIGGTIINRQRRIQINRAKFWTDNDLVEKLEIQLKQR